MIVRQSLSNIKAWFRLPNLPGQRRKAREPVIATSQTIEVRTTELPSPNTPDGKLAVCSLSARKINLPTPDEVRTQAEEDQAASRNSYLRPDLTYFPDLGLVVKWGKHITLAEGQCLWFIGTHLSEQVPVPQIFGLTQDAGETFLYMESIRGDTLSSRWEHMTQPQKLSITQQLRFMIFSWRKLYRTESKTTLSQIGGQPLCDYLFQDNGVDPAGPFSCLADFHAAIARLVVRQTSSDHDPRPGHEILAGLKDDFPLVFTHSDLDQSNILISKPEDGPIRIVAIIDWHQSGWYPEPWEYLKAKTVARFGSDWEQRYLPMVLNPPGGDYEYAFEYVVMSLI